MFVREYGLVHNYSNPERYARLVKWEVSWRDAGDGMEAKHLQPVAIERTLLDVSNTRAYDYAGPEYRLVTTAVTELSLRRWPVVAPREALPESEELRRARIRVLRRACHVDPITGMSEPAWMPDKEAHALHRTVRALVDDSAAA